MSMTDPIADLFIRILNAGRRGHETVRVPASKLKAEILRVLQTEGFIRHYRQCEESGLPVLEVGLRYTQTREKKHFITGIRRISKPGRRVYVGKTEIPYVMKGLGIAILTTAKGVMTDRECRALGIGGEVLCHVW
ncbi:MAG: 30S ribosomal protein S8 [Nitrospirae bacterium]|nr:MAG: 30S ribosomal protein S8 [Nitrospirota bacterium]